MKIQKNAEYLYQLNGILEVFGWTMWYDWNVVKRHTKIINIILAIITVIVAFSTREYLVASGVSNLFISLFLALLVWLIIITPIHEILHLLPLSGFKLGKRCVISIGKGTVSAIYNGETSKLKQCVSIILPVTVLTIILSLILLFAGSQIRIFLIFLLVLNIYGSFTDIYMLFYFMKRVRKNDRVFGPYRKEPVKWTN
ncbi:MAG: DUF3267 domain-containing protein [Clostridia bacterium]